ncbi:MAG: HD domain-containing protein [Alphaproteobacteria bacterium]|nr:HD domain-containing protein [Alphaproteobacteria bacterium]
MEGRPAPTLSQRADELEHRQIAELERLVDRSVLFTSGDRDPTKPIPTRFKTLAPGQHVLMGDDPRLQKMPPKPTLMDFFRLRFAPANHLLQSATHARKAGMSEKVVTACLLHDIAVFGFIRVDHGYWGAQLVEPYVDEEVSWAIRAHQALRFFPDESVGYSYPDQYVKLFGADFKPEPYIVNAYNRARQNKWYMTARLITVYDIYSFDPNARVSFDDFADILGRNFKQPAEGLGFDSSPVAHMWRTIIWPTKFL